MNNVRFGKTHTTRRVRVPVTIAALVVFLVSATPELQRARAEAETSELAPAWQGSVEIDFSEQAFRESGVNVELRGLGSQGGTRAWRLSSDVTPRNSLTIDVDGAGYPVLSGDLDTSGAVLLSYAGRHRVIGNFRFATTADGHWSVTDRLDSTGTRREVIRLVPTSTAFRTATQRFQFTGNLTLAHALIAELDVPQLEGVTIATVTIRLDRVSARGVSRLDAATSSGTSVGNAPAPQVAASVGPDVIVGDIHEINNYGVFAQTAAYSIGTISCNIGDTEIAWVATTNQHPVIAQNMYRLKNGRFEQIGMSWLKHGFFAVSGSLCFPDCQGTDGTTLGVHCSDPYSANLNGTQNNLGPRSEVNAFTGDFNYPPGNPTHAGSVSRRLQVALADIDPPANPGASYYVEAHYVTPDDAAAGNQDNNASYRRADITGTGTDVLINLASSTRRTLPAIRAWQAADASVMTTDIRVPGDGYLILAAKATDLGDGFWSYEYAIENIDSHRSGAWFRIPVDPTATVRNMGFHDVNYHSGEPFSNVDWSMNRSTVTVTWNTDSFDTSAFANALRWGSLYNFRFEADAPPTASVATLGLFRPGAPDRVDVPTVGPTTNVTDCNNNDIPDSTDIADGLSQDCNGNAIPDECETHKPLASLWGFGFVDPVAIAGIPGNADRVLVAERTGLIRIHEGGQTLPTPFLNLSGSITSGPEQGLLGLAVDPNFSATGNVFVAYSDLSGATVISRFTTGADPDQLDPPTEVVLKTIPQPFADRNGGVLAFGADGMLYVGMGDGGGTNDPLNSAQEPGSLLGKVLRLDTSAPPNYIPASNPFVATPLPRDEIWAVGLHDPRGLTVDTVTGDVFIPDHGQDASEEINIHDGANPPGENYAWRCMEGATCTGLSGCTCSDLSLTQADISLASDGSGCGVIGGIAYRGCAMPDQTGTYYYADTCAGSIFSLRYASGVITQQRDATADLLAAAGSVGEITVFGADGIGEVYFATTAGALYKIVSNPAVCGNSTLEPGEQCDDGNTVSGDGCTDVCVLEPAAANDLCDAAVAIGEGVFAFSTANAITDGPDEPALCNVNGQTTVDNDVWFLYTPSCRGFATVSTCVADFDSRVAAYDGGVCPTAASTAIACDDDGCAPGTHQIFNVRACEPYLIRVGGTAGATGSGSLEITCTPTPLTTDCNGNFVEDETDIICQTSTDGNGNGIPDECETTGDPRLGGRLYDNWWSELTAAPPTTDHPLWQFRPDLTSNVRTGAETWRCKECHGWDYAGVNGQYGTGTHLTGFPGILGTTLGANDIFTLLREPPSNSGGPGVPNGHDYGSVMADIRITDLVAFSIGGAIDDSAFINPTDGTFLGDAVGGVNNYQVESNPPCTLCHGANGATINFGTFDNPEYLGTIANTNPWEMIHKIRFGQPAAPMPSWLANGGTNQGAADIGRYAQLNLATECVDAAQCDDGVACTVNTCTIEGTCAFAPDDTNCIDNGLFCDGPEMCDAALGCVSVGNPCTGVCNEVDGCGCLAPLVETAGSRYLAITPQALDPATPIAILVTPTCSLGQPSYVGQPIAPLNAAPLVATRAEAAFLTNAEWGGTVYVFGQDIVPETQYEVRGDCGGPSAITGQPTLSNTGLWGDVTGPGQGIVAPPDGVVNFLDISAVVKGFLDNGGAPPVYAADLFGCRPVQVVDFSDIQAAVAAFLGTSYPEASLCPGPCWE